MRAILSDRHVPDDQKKGDAQNNDSKPQLLARLFDRASSRSNSALITASAVVNILKTERVGSSIGGHTKSGAPGTHRLILARILLLRSRRRCGSPLALDGPHTCLRRSCHLRFSG